MPLQAMPRAWSSRPLDRCQQPAKRREETVDGHALDLVESIAAVDERLSVRLDDGVSGGVDDDNGVDGGIEDGSEQNRSSVVLLWGHDSDRAIGADNWTTYVRLGRGGDRQTVAITGSAQWKVAPPSGLFSARIEPPWSVTIERLMASPRPRP